MRGSPKASLDRALKVGRAMTEVAVRMRGVPAY